MAAPIHSETAAWHVVSVKAGQLLTMLPNARSPVRGRIEEILSIARDMERQLARGLHANPALVIYGNPKRNPLVAQRGRHPSGIISRRVYAIEYKHADDGEDYRHDFSPGVAMYAFGGDGSLSLHRPDGKAISREFEV